MDALKCVTEGHEFLCHEPSREGMPCMGWAMMMLAKDTPEFHQAPWDFVGGSNKREHTTR